MKRGRKPSKSAENTEKTAQKVVEATSPALAHEMERLIAICRDQRERIERALAHHRTDYPDLDLMRGLQGLGQLVAKLMSEARQLEKLYRNEDMSEAEMFQTLIDAGWRPPRRWVPPPGVEVPKGRPKE